MAQGTRSTKRTLDAAEKHIVTITGLTEVERQSLQSNGVGDPGALSYLTFEDIAEILPDCNVVTRRKVQRLSTYLDVGGIVDA